MPCTRCNGIRVAHRHALPRLSGRGPSQRDHDVDHPGTGRRGGRLDHAPRRPRSGRASRRWRTADSSSTCGSRTTAVSNATATTCTTKRTLPSPRPSWARPSRCPRCARPSRSTSRRAAPTARSTDCATRVSSTCTAAVEATSSCTWWSTSPPTSTTPPKTCCANWPNTARKQVLDESGGLFRRRKSEKVSLLEWPRRVAAVAQFHVGDPDQPTLSAKDEHHLRTVLRVRNGEELVVTDGAGAWSLCEVGDHGLHRVTPVHVDPPSPQTTLYLAPLKGDQQRTGRS